MHWRSVVVVSLILASCSSVPKSVFEPIERSEKLETLKAVATPVAVAEKAPPEAIGVVRVKNHASTERLQWFTAVLPFPEGKVSQDELSSLSTTHGAVAASAIKYHFKNGEPSGVALAKVKFPLYLKPGEETLVSFYLQEKENPMPFAYGPGIHKVLSQPALLMFMTLKLKDDPKTYTAAMWKNPKLIEKTPHSYTYRWHSNFKNGAEPLGMTATFYMTIDNRADHGDLVVSFGNNDFDLPKSGGYDVEHVDLHFQRPFDVHIRKIEATHAKNASDAKGFGRIRLFEKTKAEENMADGAGYTYRALWSVVEDPSSLTAKTVAATKEDLPYGMALPSYWQASKAGGIVGTVLKPRGSLQAMRDSVKPMCEPDYGVKITDYHKMANRDPKATGDQPSFSSNMSLYQHQAILTSSACVIEYMLHGAQVAEFRPYYWWKDGERMSWLDTPPTCYLHNGRPHSALSHLDKGNCEVWKPRSGGAGFVTGYAPTKQEDNQHFGEPNLKSAYELTGDPWMADFLEARISLALWSYLGDYDWLYARLNSEREVRVPYNAVELMRYFPKSKLTAELKPRLVREMRIRVEGADFGGRYRSPGINENFDRYGVYFLEDIYNDNRWPLYLGVTPGGKCVNGKPCEENIGGVTWWSGFSMTFAYQMKRFFNDENAQYFIDRYMDSARFFFDSETGLNAGARRLNDWNVTKGAFTQSWHSGWFSAVEAYGRDHKNWSLFQDKILPTREIAFPVSRPGDLWSGHDKWWQ